MSKISVAACAFILGAGCSFLLNENIPVVAASPANLQTENPKPPRSIINGVTVSGFGGEAIAIPGASPVFLPLENTPIVTDLNVFEAKQSLDGLDCHNCTFANAKLRYSGGAFNFENVNFSGTTQLVLEGAAANTLAFLRFLNSLSTGIPLASPPQNKPIERKARAKKNLPQINFTVPFIGPK